MVRPGLPHRHVPNCTLFCLPSLMGGNSNSLLCRRTFSCIDCCNNICQHSTELRKVEGILADVSQDLGFPADVAKIAGTLRQNDQIHKTCSEKREQ